MIWIYFIIGLAYWFLNTVVRKLDAREDFLLPLLWFFAWPFFLIIWIIIVIIGKVGEYKNKYKNTY